MARDGEAVPGFPGGEDLAGCMMGLLLLNRGRQVWINTLGGVTGDVTVLDVTSPAGDGGGCKAARDLVYLNTPVGPICVPVNSVTCLGPVGLGDRMRRRLQLAGVGAEGRPA